jgi:hypothetical protein
MWLLISYVTVSESHKLEMYGSKTTLLRHNDMYKGQSEQLTLSNPIFCHPHTPQLLFILGGKEVGGLLVIILQF